MVEGIPRFRPRRLPLLAWRLEALICCNPTPYTLYPTHYTLHTTNYTLHTRCLHPARRGGGRGATLVGQGPSGLSGWRRPTPYTLNPERDTAISPAAPAPPGCAAGGVGFLPCQRAVCQNQACALCSPPLLARALRCCDCAAVISPLLAGRLEALVCCPAREGRCKAILKREFKLPWREAGPPYRGWRHGCVALPGGREGEG